MVAVEGDVIGHIGLPIGQAALDDRVPAPDDLEFGSLGQDGAGVSVVFGQRSKAEQEVESCYGAGRGLEYRQEGVEGGDQVGEGLPFHHIEPLLGVEDALLEFLELGCDVALSLGQGLLADPLLGDLVLVGVPYLEVVAEDVVEGDLEGGDAGGLHFALANVLELGFAIVAEVAELIEFRDHPRCDGGALSEHARRVFREFVAQPFQRCIGRVEAPGPTADDRVVGAVHDEAQGFHGGQGPPQAVQFGRRDAHRSRLGQHALQVADPPQFRDEVRPHLGLLQEGGHGFMPFHDALRIAQRLGDPPAQHPRAHRRCGPVQDVHQRHPFRVGGGEQFEVADGETVHGHVAAPFHTPEGGDVGQPVVLGRAHVVQCCSGGDDRQRLAVEPETLETLGSEMSLQGFPGEIQLPDPVVQGEAVTGQVQRLGLPVAQVKGLLGAEGPQQRSDLLGRTFTGKEFTR